MSGAGSDGQPQMHMGAPSQVQLPQMQPPMQPQMRPQPIIRHAMSVHMPQAPNIVRMQRPQIVKTGQMAVDQPVTPFVGGQARVRIRAFYPVRNTKVKCAFQTIALNFCLLIVAGISIKSALGACFTSLPLTSLFFLVSHL